MAGDIDREGVEKAYGRWAPVYDLVFGKVFDHGRQSTIAEADKIGGRVLDVGVGTGLSLSEYSRTTKLCGVDISEPMLRRALKRVRALGLTNVETLAVMDARISRSRIPVSMRWWRNMSSRRCRIRNARWMISSAC